MSASAELDLLQLEGWGRRLGGEAFPGLVVALIGPLGAGKTTLVRAIVDGAGGDPAAVTSPTFVLVQEYPGRFPIVHIDVYRLKNAQEYLDLGVDELLPESLVLIEWADKIEEQLPPDRLDVILTTVKETTRKVERSARGKTADMVTLLEALQFG